MDAITRAVAAIQYKKQFPMLNDFGNSDLISAAKNLRAELKAAFPGIKFSVTTERYAGGDSMRAKWTDGPTYDEVNAIASKYAAGKFDGMTDCYNYDSDLFNKIFGDAKYVFCNREFSDALVAECIAKVSEYYQADPITVEDYRQGRAYSWVSQGGITDMQRLLNIEMYNTSKVIKA